MARLEQVHRGNPALPAIVFIHGLGGDMFDTWVGPGASRDDCWLHWVGQDTGCDTWTLGYDAALSRWQDQAMPLPDQGTQVALALAVTPGLKERALILVGHSMGGLVIKTLMTQTQASGDARTRAMLGRICGVAFVATPHQGSQLANLAKAFSALVRTNTQVGDMSRHEAHLRQLGTAFREQRRTLQLKVVTFAEGRDVVWRNEGFFGWLAGQVGVRVVDPSSSDPALEGVTSVPLSEDHFTICKPSSRDALVHHALVAFVREDILPQFPALAAQPVVTPAQPAGPSTIPPPAPAGRPDSRLTGPQDSRLQPAEGRFYGRDDEVAQVLKFLRGPDDGAVVTAREVSGVGGIGKTEVCKAALRQWLATHPEPAAWFVQLADGANLAELIDRLSNIVGVPDVQTPEQLLQALPAGLYYLDNLESVASSGEGAAFLRALQLRPEIRLLVSSRYSLPTVFGKSIEIGVLPPDAALRLFRELWLGHDLLPSDAAMTDFVVGDLGCHALSVTLAARLGDCYSYLDLVQRWREVGAAILQQPGESGRHGSLPASLRLTAEALSQTPGALNMWTVLALFATGASSALVRELEQRSGWAGARPALVRHHVINRQPDGRWTMLPPLARYALGASLGQADGFNWAEARGPVRALFSDQAEAADSVQSTAASLEARAWLIAHFGSLAGLLRHEMQAKPPDTDWLQKLHHSLNNLYQFKLFLAVDLLQQLSTVLLQPATALKLLGDLKSRLGAVDEARTLYNRALAQYDGKQGSLQRANTLRALGALESRLGRMDAARALYEQALAEFEQEQSALGQANTLKVLGDLESRMSHIDQARDCYGRALAHYEREHDGLGQANTLRALGDVERRQGQLGKARGLYDRALAQYEREHAELGQANTLRVLGDLERWQGRMVEARALYNRALAFYERDQLGLGQANTFFALGELDRHLGQLDEARMLFEKALALYEREQDQLGQANTLQVMGDLVQASADPAAVAPIYKRAVDCYVHEQEPVGLALASAKLARCLHAMNREAERDESLMQAIDAASRAGAEPVLQYVRTCLEDLIGGQEAAQAWLSRQLKQDGTAAP